MARHETARYNVMRVETSLCGSLRGNVSLPTQTSEFARHVRMKRSDESEDGWATSLGSQLSHR